MNDQFFCQSDEFLQLPVPVNSEKKPRKAGFEFEYTNVSLINCAQLLAREFDGVIEEKNGIEFYINKTRLGCIKIETDWKLAQKIAEKDWKRLPKVFREYLEKVTQTMSQKDTFPAPWEIVTEPLCEEQFPHLEKLRSILFQNRAKGVSANPLYAFGTHINCEIPNREIASILNYLRAFLILYPRLLEKLSVHPSRRILTYIDPFPSKYTKKVLDGSYQPDEETFINDYLEYNTTRNRALDLLPLLCHLCPGTQEKIHRSFREMVKPRPAFHYRLPNCDFGNPKWRVAHVWNSWVAVERLAADKENLERLSKESYDKLCHPWRWRLKKIFNF